MKRIGMALALLLLVSATVDAGWPFKKHKPAEEVPGGHPEQLVTPNGVVVPAWASRRIQESPVPLYGKSWGRRPWALPLSTQGTPSAVYARIYQNGFGAGPTPGYTNGYGIAGNMASAPVGPGDGPGWGPPPGSRNLFMPSFFPFNTALSGY
jgi:hypothetical protein